MILGRSIVDIFENSYTMQLLLLVSIVAVALILERLYFLLKSRININRVSKNMQRAVKNGEIDEFIENFTNKKHPLYRILKVLYDNKHLDTGALYDLLDAHMIRESKKVRANVVGLSTIAAIAPLLGLYGTVVGLIKAFYNIVLTGSGGPEVVAGGIAEALLTTAFGLIIAIPTLVVHNYFAKKADDMLEGMEAIAKEFIAFRDLILKSNYEKTFKK